MIGNVLSAIARQDSLRAGVVALLLVTAHVTSASPLPTTLNGAILLKLLAFEDGLKRKSEISILVVNDDALAANLRQKLGAKVGRGKLVAVHANSLPEGVNADVIYLNGERQLHSITDYARKHGALTVGNDLALAHRGVALILFDDEGLPGVTISMKPSKALGLKWDPKVLEISQLIY